MSKDASPPADTTKDPTLSDLVKDSDLVKEIRRWLEDSKRPSRIGLLGLGADFTFAIAFFALSFIANIVASWVVQSDGAPIVVLFSALVGLVMLRLWHIARDYESGRAELINSVRDVELITLIVEHTVAALAKRQPAPQGSSDGGSDSEAVPASHKS